MFSASFSVFAQMNPVVCTAAPDKPQKNVYRIPLGVSSFSYRALNSYGMALPTFYRIAVLLPRRVVAHTSRARLKRAIYWLHRSFSSFLPSSHFCLTLF
jgi:hypothetical protein